MRKEIVLGTVLLLPLIAAAADFTPLAVKPAATPRRATLKPPAKPAARPEPGKP